MTGENAKGESKNLPVTRITARGILIGSLLLTLDHVLVHLSHTLPLLLAHLLGFLGPRRFGGASLGLDGAGGGGGRWDALRRRGAAGSGGVGAVEAALEGPRVRRGRAHALGPAAVAVAAAGGRGREAPAHGAR